MAALMSAQVEELGENRVRLTVDVSPHELEHAVEHATNDLSESVKIPGFRKGKVPTPVLVSKIGKDRIWVEAVESHISGWFWSAASRTRLRPISAPEYDFELPTTDKEAVVVLGHDRGAADARDRRLDDARGAARRGRGSAGARRPGARGAAADRRGARAGRRPPGAGRATRSSSTCRARRARRSRTRSSSSARAGSSRRSRPRSIGASVGETKEVDVRARRRVRRRRHDHGQARQREGAAGDRRRAGALGERVRHARRAARGHRGARSRRGRGGDRRGVQDGRRRRARRPPRTSRGPARSSRRGRASCSTASSARSAGAGIAPDTYFEVTGQSPEVLVAQMHAEAARSVARELALEAVADKAGIEISDDDVKALIREQAEAVRRRSRAGDRGHLGARPPGVAARGPSPARARSTASSPT